MRKLLALALALGLATPALAQNYQATQGSGTTFGSKLVTAVNYPQQLMCDPTTPANCLAVNASGQVTITNTTFAATQSGTWNIGSITTLPALAAGSAIIGKVGIDQTTPGTTNLVSIGTNGTINPQTIGTWGLQVSTQNSATPTNMALIAGQFNTTPTTITTGNVSALQLDNAGKLLVNCTGCSSSSSITSWGGGTLGAMANYGTSPGAVLVPGMNAFVTNATPGIANNADAIATVAASATSPVPVNNYGYIFNGTTMDRMRSGTTTGSVLVNGAGTAGSASGGIVTVQGVASMTKLLVTPDSVALPANQSVNVAQIAGVATPVGSGVQATAPRMTLATDSPGLITLGPATVANSVPQTISSQYPTNATTTTPTAVTATATGTTAATAASLGATASVTNFVCGFTITADATALATGTATLSGTISGSLNYLQTIVAVTSGASILSQNFNPCIPASAANTAITITSAAAGTGGNTIVNIWGYRL